MRSRYWGGRFPLENYLCSKAVFFLFAYGRMRRRLINRFKRAVNPPSVTLLNDSATKRTVVDWIAKGYDRLNIGGGPKNLSGFVNIDFATYARVERQISANILDLSFIPDECVSQIHSNHVVEHLSQRQLETQVNEWYRILKDEGIVSLRCPNALGAAYGFWFEPVIESRKEDFIKAGFPADENFGNAADRWVHKDLFGLIHWFYGDIGNIENQHLSRLTPTVVRDLLLNAGFQILEMAEPEALNIAVVARKKSIPGDAKKRNTGVQSPLPKTSERTVN